MNDKKITVDAETAYYTLYKPQIKWRVYIPKGNTFCITYQELTLMQRLIFRFISWGVEYTGDKK